MKTKDTSVDTKITVTIHGSSFEMTVAEAKKLKAQLEAVIPEKPNPIFIPQPYPVPAPAPEPRPWRDRPWGPRHPFDDVWRDRITCGGDRQDMMVPFIGKPMNLLND